MAEGNGIAEIFDAREDGLKCVRFESGEVGMVENSFRNGRRGGCYGPYRLLQHPPCGAEPR